LNPAPLNPAPLNQPPLNQPRLNQPPLNQAPLNQQPPLDQQQPGDEAVPSGPEMRQRLRQSLNELPDAVRELRVTLDEFRVVLQSANRNLKNLEGFTEPLGQKGSDITAALTKAVTGLDQLVTDFTTLTQAINNRRGTVGKLLYDDAKAYDNLLILMTNANTVLGDIHDLAFRLKPVVNDARIFMDKIATEPGRIVTGGLNPSPVK
jgi:phospholipid/cholesterol/gamma-HCH transport system substrate-binding protein